MMRVPENAGRRGCGRVHPGSRPHWCTAVRKKNSYYHAQFHCLRSRRGTKKAICAVAASMLTTIYHMLGNGTCYLCWAVSFGAKCHQGADDREARYRHPLAPCRFQIVLPLEIAEPLWPTDCAVGNSLADPRDEHRQPVVGSAENPWRAS